MLPFRLWMWIGSLLSVLGVLGAIYGKGYFACKQDVASSKAISIIEGNKQDAKTEREVLNADERTIDKRFSKWVLYP